MCLYKTAWKENNAVYVYRFMDYKLLFSLIIPAESLVI